MQMTTTTERKVDRTGWDKGPWDDEPDRVEWRTAAGLPGLALRARSGNWCGYVAVPPGHPAHGAQYSDLDVEVHGGLTYANRCAGRICHVPEPGEPDDVYWLGFDCAHAWDIRPADDAFWRKRGEEPMRFDGSTYRTIAYVRAECESLARQLAGMR
jgi:hypothetical protein